MRVLLGASKKQIMMRQNVRSNYYFGKDSAPCMVSGFSTKISYTNDGDDDDGDDEESDAVMNHKTTSICFSLS